MSLRALPTDWGVAVVRIMAGFIITVASFEKFFGGGFEGFTKVTSGLGIPAPELWGVVIPLLELIGGLMILVGFGARWVAFLFVIEYFVTSFLLKVPRQPPFGGWDSMRIDLMLFATAIAVALVGPGALALESLVLRRGRQQVAVAEGATST
jgi:putative oxidoreductase